MPKAMPFSHLTREHWVRLLDFAALAALVLFLVYVAIETYVAQGVDFRGYYAAARVLMRGSDPYDYTLVSRVLLEVTGEMGNNPYYYPPWFVVTVIPLAWLPFQAARLVWILILVGAYWMGADLSLRVLRTDLHGWRRWLAISAGAYLLIWLSVRSEQLGSILLLMLALSLWAYQRRIDWLAGLALALTLTKPNVTWLTVPVVGLLFLQRRRRAAWWAVGSLAVLAGVSTIIAPTWFQHLADPDFGAGLSYVLDGPDQVTSIRLSATLSDWLGRWGIAGGWVWAIWIVLALACGIVLAMAWRRRVEGAYLASLATAFGLLLTPYALQYDYPPLVLGLFWVFSAVGRAEGCRRWLGYGLLTLAFSVPVWERPIYDGYWMLLALVAALLVLSADLWAGPLALRGGKRA